MNTNIVLATAAALLAVPTAFTFLAESNRYTDIWGKQMMFDGFDPAQFDTIAMRRPKPAEGESLPGVGTEPVYDEIAFRKVNNRWVIAGGELAGAPVKEDLLEQRIFQHMVRIPAHEEALIVEGAEQGLLEENELTPATAFAISCQVTDQTAQNGLRVVAELLVGKHVSGGRTGRESVPGYYVLQSRTNDVYLYEVPLWERPLDDNEWVDKIVHNISQPSIVRFSLRNQKTGSRVLFERKPGSDGTWNALEKPDGFGGVNQDVVNTMIDRYTHIQAQNLVGQATPQAIAVHGLRPASTLEVSATLDDGSVFGVEVGNKVAERNEYYALSTGLEFIRTVPEWVVTNFQLGPEQMFGPAAVKDPDKDKQDPPKPDPDQPGK